MKKSLIGVALASAFFGAVLAHSNPAAAWWTRQYGGTLSNQPSGDRVYTSVTDFSVLSTSSIPVTTATTVNVETYFLRSDTLSTVQICAAQWAGSGEACSPTQTASGVGHHSFFFGNYVPSIWSSAADFQYVAVSSGNSANAYDANVRVNGIFIAQ